MRALCMSMPHSPLFTTAVLTLLLTCVLWLCCSHPGFSHLQEGHPSARLCLLVLPADGRHPRLLLCVCGAPLAVAAADRLTPAASVPSPSCTVRFRFSGYVDSADRQDRLACINRRHQPAAAWNLSGSCCMPESHMALVYVLTCAAAFAYRPQQYNTVQASGWLMETLLTMTLVFVVFAATDAKRAKIATHLPVGSCMSCQEHAPLAVNAFCLPLRQPMTRRRRPCSTAHRTAAA